MKTLSLTATGLLLIAYFCSAQPDSIQYQKSEQFKHEMSMFLSEKAEYPQKAAEDNIWGDIVISRVIDLSGNLSEPRIVKSSNTYLSLGALKTLENLSNKWDPADMPYLNFGREYLFVFRYRTYMNVVPADPKIKAIKLLNEKKYDKALKLFDKAIEENQYEHELYVFRAECKKQLGDNTGSTEDYAMAEKLRNEVMAIVKVTRIGEHRTHTTINSEYRIVAVPVK